MGGRAALIRSLGAGDYEGLRPDDAYVGLQWTLSGGRRVQLNSTGPVTEQLVRRFADGLRLLDLAATSSPFSWLWPRPDWWCNECSGRTCACPRRPGSVTGTGTAYLPQHR